MTNKFGRTRQRTNNLGDEMIWGGGWTPSGDKSLVYHCANRTIQRLSIFSIKRKYYNYRCPDYVYSNTLLLIIYLSVIETLICRREKSLIGSTSFGFAQNTIHDFQKKRYWTHSDIVLDKCHKIRINTLWCITPLPHGYPFWHINNRPLLKTLWKKKKLLVPSNFFFFHNVFYSIRYLYPYLSIYLTSYLYLLLNWKSPKLAYHVKG